jgi:hypothetical protein
VGDLGVNGLKETECEINPCDARQGGANTINAMVCIMSRECLHRFSECLQKNSDP